MNCPRCDTEVIQSDKYCPKCGLALEAARKGMSKKPGKRDYEEASTQLVDVKEFKEYLANENSRPAPPVSKTSNLAEAAPPVKRNLADLSSPSSPLPPAESKAIVPAPEEDVVVPAADTKRKKLILMVGIGVVALLAAVVVAVLL